MKKIFLVVWSLLFCGLSLAANTPTSNFGFPKPGVGDYGPSWMTDYNNKMDAADTSIKAYIDAADGILHNFIISNNNWQDLTGKPEITVGDPGYTTFATAIVALNLNSTPRNLIVPAGEHIVSSDMTVNSNIRLKFQNGAVLTIATTKTLTINGPLDAGLYQIFSCTGTGKVVFGSGRHVSAAWWGDTGPAVQAAVNSLIGVTGQVILTPNTSYAVTTTLTTYKGIELVGSNSIFDFSGLTTPDTAFVINPHPTISLQGMNPIARDVHFKGNVTMAGNVGEAVTYTANLTGLEINTSNISFDHCPLTGFDKATNFGSNSYAIEFNQCTSRFNNYGFYFDATGKTNLGEKISWTCGGITNNNYGIYNNLGELFFRNISLDYNKEAHIAENITDLGGVASTVMNFDGCHIENTKANSAEGKVRITNSGRLVIRGGMVYDDANSIITNSGTLVIDSPIWRIAETKYTITNTGRVSAKNIIPIASYMNSRLCRELSGIQNNGMETGNTTGWTATTGTNFAASTDHPYEGTYGLRVGPTAVGTATVVNSKKCIIPPGCPAIELTAWGFNGHSAADGFLVLRIFDIDDNGVDAQVAALTHGGTANARYYISTTAPPNGGYAIVEVSIAASATTNEYIYMDEFYLRMD